MKSILGWVARIATSKPDPVSEQWYAWWAAESARRIADQRGGFDWQATVGELQIPPSRQAEAAFRVYQYFLRRAWGDGKVSREEWEKLRWVANCVGIADADRERLNRWSAERLFDALFRKSIADHEISEQESTQLRAVAASIGLPVGALTSEYLTKGGESLLRSVLSETDADPTPALRRLLASLAVVGVAPSIATPSLQSAARNVANELISYAKADGKLSESERTTVTKFVEFFELGHDMAAKVSAAFANLEYAHLFEGSEIGQLSEVINNCPPKHYVDWRLRDGGPRYDSIVQLCSGFAVWRITRQTEAVAKYNAGASWTIQRTDARLLTKPPRQLRAAFSIGGFQSSSESLFFTPVGLLLVNSSGSIGVPFSDIETENVRFVESDSNVPGATQVDSTWERVNKDGAPDMRFSDNRRLPVMLYTALRIPSRKIEYQVSAAELAPAIKSYVGART